METSVKVKKIAIIVLAIFLVIILVTGFASLSAQPKPITAEPVPTSEAVIKGEEYVDGTPEDEEKADIASIKDTDAPVYSNIDNLKRSDGFTTEHVDGLQYGFYQFAQQENLDIRKLLIDIESAEEVTAAEATQNGIYTVAFTFSFGEKSYKAEVGRRSLAIVELRVYEPAADDKQLFDSGDINGNKL